MNEKLSQLHLKKHRALSLSRFAILSFAVSLILLLSFRAVQAVDGELDLSFGTNGKTVASFATRSIIEPHPEPHANSRPSALALQADGKILLAGQTFFTKDLSSTDSDFSLMRYNSDGSLDGDFGSRGIINADLFGLYEHGDAVAVQPDGDILVAGFINAYTPLAFNAGDFLLLRFTPDGRLDNRFGDAGAVVTDFGLEDHAVLASLQKDGRILVAGYLSRTLLESRPSDFSLARYAAYTPPDFSLSLSQATVQALRGQTIEVEIQVNRTGGFTKPLTISAPDVSQLKIKLNPQTITSSDASVRFTMKIKKAPAGLHELIFVARDEAGRERLATLKLNIRKN